MTQVETNVIQAMANAGNVDQELQNHILKLVVAHDKAVANYKNAMKTCRTLEAQLKDVEQYSNDLEAAIVKDNVEIKPVIDLRKEVDKTEEKW
tara:strand:- start:147 stop:425 length:279 start_codon:yes stop_codon:yes gene_type:complete